MGHFFFVLKKPSDQFGQEETQELSDACTLCVGEDFYLLLFSRVDLCPSKLQVAMSTLVSEVEIPKESTAMVRNEEPPGENSHSLPLLLHRGQHRACLKQLLYISNMLWPSHHRRLQEIIDAIKDGSTIDQVMIETTVPLHVL